MKLFTISRGSFAFSTLSIVANKIKKSPESQLELYLAEWVYKIQGFNLNFEYLFSVGVK